MYRKLRERVYEANMELFRRKLIVYTWGNVSEVDREKGVMAIKPSGVPYEELKPEMIVIQSLETGEVVYGDYRPSSDAPTHLALYRAFEEVGGVVHTHSTCATAWAQAGLAIPCMGTTHADYFHGDIPVTRFLTPEETEEDYEGNTGKVIIEAFQGRNPIHTPGVLANGHGPFTWGKNGADAVLQCRRPGGTFQNGADGARARSRPPARCPGISATSTFCASMAPTPIMGRIRARPGKS